MSFKEQEREHQTVIERLRAKNPERNILSLALEQLDNPAEMSEFFFQFVNELASDPDLHPHYRYYPYDTADEDIKRLAPYYGEETNKRWNELLKTGIVQDIPDHSLDWITQEGTRLWLEEGTRRPRRIRQVKARCAVTVFNERKAM